MAEQQTNPRLISKKAMTSMANTKGTSGETVHEIFTKINNAKDKPRKIEVLKQYDQPYMRQLLKAAFYSKSNGFYQKEYLLTLLMSHLLELNTTYLNMKQKDCTCLLRVVIIKLVKQEKKLCLYKC